MGSCVDSLGALLDTSRAHGGDWDGDGVGAVRRTVVQAVNVLSR
jgi:hypothetical protein